MGTRLENARSRLRRAETIYHGFEAASEAILADHRKAGAIRGYRPGLWNDAYDYDARQDRLALDRIGERLRNRIADAREEVKQIEKSAPDPLDTPLIP